MGGDSGVLGMALRLKTPMMDERSWAQSWYGFSLIPMQ